MTNRQSAPFRFLAATALLAATLAQGSQPLRGQAADLAHTTVSGVSSGGYMAVQFHVANSRIVKGAGVLAAGPWYCAQGSVFAAYYRCMAPSGSTPLPPLNTLKRFAQVFEATGGIDRLDALAGSRVWLFAGSQDETVAPEVVEALRNWYRLFVGGADIAMVTGVPAGHGMATLAHGVPCETTASPFINACRYDAAGALLAHLYGRLAPPAPEPQAGRLLRFDQAEFSGGAPYAISMGDEGLVFVPDACAKEPCGVHIAFHGCGQGMEAIGEEFAREAGYNRWAAANRIIVLYPQAVARYGWGWGRGVTGFVFNPRGCWDWWGYTGPGYVTRSGPQMRAVRAMLGRLAQPRDR